MPVFKNVACGLVDDCPDEVFGGVGQECLGLCELLGGKCVPPYGWFLGGWDGQLAIGDDAVDDVHCSDSEVVLTGQQDMPSG